MAESLLDLGNGLELWKLDVDELIEQDLNARAMSREAFERLQTTIGRDKRLEALPFVAKTEKGIEIISGHHRVRAARAAEVKELHAIVDVSGLSRDQIASKQLAHNAIQGTDDPQLLKKIYESIGSVEDRLEAFIDEKAIGIEIGKVAIPNLDLGLEFRTALIVFLPHEKARFEKAVEVVTRSVAQDATTLYQADLDLLELWRKVMRRVGKEYDVRATGTVLSHIAGIVLQQLGESEEDESEPDAWVSLRDVLGVSMIPKAAAEVITIAIERMMQRDGLSKKAKWMALELWAADYVSGL